MRSRKTSFSLSLRNRFLQVAFGSCCFISSLICDLLRSKSERVMMELLTRAITLLDHRVRVQQNGQDSKGSAKTHQFFFVIREYHQGSLKPQPDSAGT